ncbi:MAG: hypothetical protein KatS3mg126_1817 [Lysobacteraceae bacterium]|nr:MAG: hypothetical protein KatS3mg126_1817 [Xanthomonadaceae bacterium]
MSAIAAHLEALFRSACYRIRLDEDWHETFVGQRSSPVAAWLARHGFDRASLISARNPQGRPLGEEDNRRRERALRQRLEALGLQTLAAEGAAPDRRFVEPSLWVPGLGGEACRLLMRDFDQLAWVEYDALGLARLCWTHETEEQQPCGQQ